MTALRGILTSEEPVAAEVANEALNSLVEIAIRPVFSSLSSFSAERLLELNAEHHFLTSITANGLSQARDGLPIALPMVAALRRVEEYTEDEPVLIRLLDSETFAQGRIVRSGLEAVVGRVAVGVNGFTCHSLPGYAGLMKPDEFQFFSEYSNAERRPRYHPAYVNFSASRLLTVMGIINSCSASLHRSLTRTPQKKDYHPTGDEPYEASDQEWLWR